MSPPGRGAPAAFPETSRWSARDRWDAARCRLGRNHRRYSVLPGLYAINHPNARSPLLATASYKLTFDLLRRSVGSEDGWILVLDTHGMGVGCALSTGTFSTAELAREVLDRRVSLLVEHRRIVVPPLARGVLEPEALRRHTGFGIRYGPHRLADLPAFLRSQCPELPPGPAPFGLGERTVLAPGELWQSLPLFAGFALVAFVYAGLTPAGLSLGRAWNGVWPLVALGAGAVCAGSLVAPLLPPLRPRWLPLSGWAVGALFTAVLLHLAGLSRRMDAFLLAACYLFFPGAAAWLALRFRRAAPTPDHAAKEARPWVAPAAVAGGLTVTALVLSRLHTWGML